jgi:hypothetical protein
MYPREPSTEPHVCKNRQVRLTFTWHKIHNKQHVACTSQSSALKMETVRYSATSENLHRIARSQVSEVTSMRTSNFARLQ